MKDGSATIVATAGGVTSSGIGGCGFVEPYEENGSTGSTGKIVVNDGQENFFTRDGSFYVDGAGMVVQL